MISVFTAFHKLNTTFLQETYQSLKDQTFTDWEWIIVLNGRGIEADLSFIKDDEKVKTFVSVVAGNIGYLKNYASSKCSGKVLAELDYDDILLPDCLQEIDNAFQDENIQMAYSNDALFIDGNWKPFVFLEEYGWQHRPFKYKGKELVEMVQWKPSAQSFRRVEWTPDHIRAWRKSAYEKIGGHDIDLSIGDDHDLCCRFYIEYGATGIKHIDKCLYLYRKQEDGNSSFMNNKGIQEQTDKNYCKYSRKMAIRWAKDSGLRMIDLGGRFNAWEGFETVDLLDADIICDLNKRWEFEDNSVGILRASHIFEHLKDPIHTMNEAYRVLAPGGWLFIEVPSTDGRGAWQDPTHCSFWNSNSFWYYTKESHAKYIRPMYKGRFQLSRIINWHPTEFEKMHDILICEADLICLKDGFRHCGEVLI